MKAINREVIDDGDWENEIQVSLSVRDLDTILDAVFLLAEKDLFDLRGALDSGVDEDLVVEAGEALIAEAQTLSTKLWDSMTELVPYAVIELEEE